MAEVKATEHEFEAEDGARFFCRGWVPAEPASATLVLVHGGGEHIGRYDHFARFLCDHGYAVYGMDHRGHGRSSGVKGHIDGCEQYTADLDRFIGRLIDDEATATDPLLMLGHSMGGLIAVLYRLDYPARPVTKTVVTGALLQLAIEVPGWKTTMGNLLAGALPRLRMATGLDAKLLTHDAEIVHAYETDPLVYGQVSTRWFTSTSEGMERALRDAGRLDGPWLVAFGDQDGICHPDGSRRLYEALTTPDKKLIEYPGMYHEILNETDKQEVYDDVLQWLDAARGG